MEVAHPDKTDMNDVAQETKELYRDIAKMNLDFQAETAGAKVAKDQSGKVSA